MKWSFTISTTTSQPSCKVVTNLQGSEHLAQIATTLWQPCHNLTKLQQGCYNLVISVWVVSEAWGHYAICAQVYIPITTTPAGEWLNSLIFHGDIYQMYYS